MSRSREECLSEFARCVESLREGRRDPTQDHLRSVREKHGQDVANQCRTEIIKFARSGKPCPKL